MSAPVDVLAMMDLAYRHLNGGGDSLSAAEFATAHAGINEARAAVAELIDAAEHASNVLAETYAKYQTKIGPFASQSQVANGKLRAALARVQP